MNKFLNRIGLLLLGVVAISSCNANTPISESISTSIDTNTYTNGTYQNPLMVINSSGSFYSSEIADPCVVRGDDGYIYSFSTSGRVLRSEDGCEWQIYSENIIPRPSWGDTYYENKIPTIWAPDVVKVQDKWIYYYSLSAWGGPCGIGYAIADEIAGPYTDMGRLFDSGDVGGNYSLGINNSIDPQVIVDEDGSVYMVLGSFNKIYMVQLTEDGMGLYGGIQAQKENKILIASNVFEGSWIFKRGDYWYYMGSVGTCCKGKDSTYRVRVGKSQSLTGPYIDSENKSMDAASQENGELVVWAKKSNENTIAPGHNSVIKDDAGDYWWYGHTYYAYDNFATRHLAMDKLLWDEDDMPYVEGRELSYEEELDGPRWLEEE